MKQGVVNRGFNFIFYYWRICFIAYELLKSCSMDVKSIPIGG